MINRKTMITIFLLLLVSTTFLLHGCKSKEGKPIVTLDDKNLTIEDFLYDIYMIELEGNRLEDYYQSNLGYGYWNYEYNGSTMREAAKSSVLTRVVKYEILSDQARNKDFVLTDLEISTNKEAIDVLIKNSPHEILSDIGLTREVLTTAYNKISLGDKYYLELSKDFKIDGDVIRNSIKKEDHREYQTECLFIPTVKTANQTITPFSEEEVRVAYETITKALKQLEDGTKFDVLLSTYNRLAYYSRNFIYGNSRYETAFQEAAVSLENGEYSDIVTTNYGYYIIHMLDNNSLDQYELAVEDALAQEEDKQFSVIYNKIKAQYDITINFEYWNTITLGSITTPKGN